MGGYKVYFAGSTRLVAAAPCPLDKTGHPLRAAHLDDALHRAEVHPQVEAGGADYRFEAALMEGRLHPIAQLTADRTVVHGNSSSQIGSCFQKVLIPYFTLGAGIGENECAFRLFDNRDSFLQQLDPQVARPGEALDFVGEDSMYFDLLVDIGTHNLAKPPLPRITHQHRQGFFHIADGGRNTPNFEARQQRFKAG